jgi:hypothetical protein
MFARLFTLIPKSITQNSDLKVVKNLACDVSAQVPKLMGWSVPLGLLGMNHIAANEILKNNKFRIHRWMDGFPCLNSRI